MGHTTVKMLDKDGIDDNLSVTWPEFYFTCLINGQAGDAKSINSVNLTSGTKEPTQRNPDWN